MSVLSLYKSCLRRIAIDLREGFYKSCQENPFSVMPSKFVDDLMSAAWDRQCQDGPKVDGLEQLLTSGMLRELKIHNINVSDLLEGLAIIRKALDILKSGCQKLKILHLVLVNFQAGCRKPDIFQAAVTIHKNLTGELLERRAEVSEALENLFRSAPNLEDLHCSFSFDLTCLRNCKKLTELRLHFNPQQPWYEFLAKENDHFQPHKYLEFVSVCHGSCAIKPKTQTLVSVCHEEASFGERIDDFVIILQNCPELTSLGHWDTSMALSRLHEMDGSPSEYKLRHCRWIKNEPGSQLPNEERDRIRKAALLCPMLEELDITVSCLESIQCLENLQNLVVLKITCDEIIDDAAFNEALRAIGSQLKHLYLTTVGKVDLSLVLQNCHNLETFRIDAKDLAKFALPDLSLPNLKRLTLFVYLQEVGQVFRHLRGCNQLTELFLLNASDLNDDTLIYFLERNSLSNLKMARLSNCDLTERGFRELLLKAPQLEKVDMFNNSLNAKKRTRFMEVVLETNHKPLCDESVLFDHDFFQKRTPFSRCEFYNYLL